MPAQNKKIPFEDRLAALRLTKEEFYELVKLGATLDGLEKKRHPLAMAIHKKIKAQERAYGSQYFLGVLARLSDERQRPSPDDKITNPLAIRDPNNDYGSAIYSTVAEKRLAYNRALATGAVAYVGFEQTIPLWSQGAEFNKVEFIAGQWRVQNETQYDTISVQEKNFVLIEPFDLTKHTDPTEHTYFEYYSAADVIWTGCGRSCDNKPGYIIGKHETGRGTFYAYGCQWADGPKKALATAHAHLAGQVYLAYKDLIIDDTIRANKAAQSGQTKQKKLFQDKYEIISVQTQEAPQNAQQAKEPDRQFVLLNKLNRTENTDFEYYAAARIDSDGQHSSLDPYYIVAKYKTGRGTFYAYGCKITDSDALASARAHLAVRVYDAYQDMIENRSRQELAKQK